MKPKGKENVFWTCIVVLLAGSLVIFPTEVFSGKANQWQGYKKLRYDEDYSYLKDPANRIDAFDPVKFIPLTNAKESYISIGGEVRPRYEYAHNPEWGQAPQDEKGVFLQRYVLHGDVHLGKEIRVFSQLMSALENGREGGPSPVDENRLALQQLFVDSSFHVFPEGRFIFRPGRQELAFGSGRLVDVREGPNVRRRFDAVHGIYQLSDWRIDVLIARPVEEKSGIFDDRTSNAKWLWGVYGVRKAALFDNGSIDLYYLGFQEDDGRFQQGVEDETRHSIGTRVWGGKKGWDYNFEFVYQFGEFGVGRINAWTLASDTGFTWEASALKPRLGLRADMASGDRDPDDSDLETFNPLFPRGNYFSEIATVGPRNFFDIHPFLTLIFTSDLAATVDLNFLWRQSTEDGIYSPSGQLLRASQGSDAKFVAATLSLTSEWQINRHFKAGAIYAHSFPGDFIKETGTDDPIDFFELTLRYIF